MDSTPSLSSAAEEPGSSAESDADGRAPAPAAHDLTGLLLDAICMVDPEGRFLSIRGACEAIFGYTPEEMIGKPMIGFVYEADRARTLQAVDRVMGGYLQRHFENRYVRKDGRLVHIMWSARWVPEGRVRVAVARDITARRNSAERAETLETAETAPAWRLCGSPPRLVAPGLSAVPLSAQDHVVLLALGKGAGGVVRRQAIVEALGEDYLQYDQRRLDTQMRRLRRKVEQACGLQLPVATVRGVGYRFFQAIEISL
jgi:PAS domain S-box-containing protein